jgi:hypothetical protein
MTLTSWAKLAIFTTSAWGERADDFGCRRDVCDPSWAEIVPRCCRSWTATSPDITDVFSARVSVDRVHDEMSMFALGSHQSIGFPPRAAANMRSVSSSTGGFLGGSGSMNWTLKAAPVMRLGSRYCACRT